MSREEQGEQGEKVAPERRSSQRRAMCGAVLTLEAIVVILIVSEILLAFMRLM